jgi:16S rRNA (guanine966-N2)-methyltransferase
VTRVIAGAVGGRRLSVPPGNGTRPTSDRAREGLFASIISELGDLDGAHVMDLYAGSGAVGLEALSRGASSVLFVESDARAAAVIRANIKAVGMRGATVAQDRVERLLTRPPAAPERAAHEPAAHEPARYEPAGQCGQQPARHRDRRQESGYDLVFADPPYAVTDEAVSKVLTLLADGWLAPGALIVVERATRSGLFQWPPGFVGGKSRRYGEATFWYGSYGTGAGSGQAGQPQTQPHPQTQASASGPALDAPYTAHEE